VDKVLDTSNRDITNANKVNLFIFLGVVFFLAKLSRILPLFFNLFT